MSRDGRGERYKWTALINTTIGTLMATIDASGSFIGLRSLLGPALGTLSPARQAAVTGHAFFPGLISGPFHHGLSIVFTFALAMCLIAAAASWLRGSGTGTAKAATSDLTASEIPVRAPETAPALAWNPEMIIEEDA